MKISEWIEKMEEPVRGWFKTEFERQGAYDRDVALMSDAVMQGFDWTASVRGPGYWADIYWFAMQQESPQNEVR